MKKMKTETKRKVAGIIAIVLIAALLLSSVLPFFVMFAEAKEATNDFTVEAVIGFDSASDVIAGVVRENEINTFNITVKNNTDKAFNGYVQIPIVVAVKGYENICNNYYKSVSLSAGEEKKVSFSLPVRFEQNIFEISILNNKKKVLQTEKFMATLKNTSMIGVLSNGGTYAYVMSKINTYEKISAFSFSASNLENEDYLHSLSALIIDNFKLSELTDGQKQTLKSWVNKGGCVIFGTENPQEETEFENLFNISSDESFLMYFDSDINIYKAGNGYVSYNGFLLNDTNKAYLKSIDLDTELQFYFDTNTGAVVEIQNSLNNEDFELLDYRYMYIVDDIGTGILFAGLYVYALGIGVVLYFVLNKKNKKDLAIKIVPVTAVAFTAIIFVFSLGSDYNKPIINGVVQIDAGKENLNDEAVGKYMVSAPYKAEVNVFVNAKATILNACDNYYGYYSYDVTDNDDVYSNINLDENNIQILNSQVWDKHYINVRTPVDIQGNLENNIVYEYSNLSGYVVNNTGYTLEDCMVGVVEGESDEIKYCFVEELKNGETVNLSSTSDLISKKYYAISDISSEEEEKITAIEKQRLELTEEFVREISGNGNVTKTFVVGFAQDYEKNITLNTSRVRDASEAMIYSLGNSTYETLYYD